MKPKLRRVSWQGFWLLMAAMAFVSTSAFASDLPAGFVYLSDVDPTIHQDIRYYGSHNFTGQRVEGYDAPQCILTKEAAAALSRVQAALRQDDLSLIVWDCYRPLRAVADFLKWSKSPSEPGLSLEFFPNKDKASLFAQGYIAVRSAHSRGSTVDLGLAPRADAPSAFDPKAVPMACTTPKPKRFHDGALDMGTGFDCMDEASHFDSAIVPREARENRALLRAVMSANGFKPYEKEWWHFELQEEPFHEGFDFPVTAKER